MREVLNPVVRLRESNLYKELPILGMFGRASLAGMSLVPFWGIIYKSLVLTWTQQQRCYQRNGDIVSGYSENIAVNGENFATSLFSSLALALIALSSESWFIYRYNKLHHSLRGLRESANHSLLPNLDTFYGRLVNAARKQSLFDSLNVGLISALGSSYVLIIINGFQCVDFSENTNCEMPTQQNGETLREFRFDLNCVERQGAIGTSVVISTTVLAACLFQAYIRWRNRSNESRAGYRLLDEDSQASLRV